MADYCPSRSDDLIPPFGEPHFGLREHRFLRHVTLERAAPSGSWPGGGGRVAPRPGLRRFLEVALLGMLFAAAWLCTLTQAHAQDETRVLAVHFPPGATGTTISASIKGRQSISYTIGAQAGQEMTVRLTSPNDAAYFNLYAPGRGPGDEALANSEMSGTEMVPEINRFSGVLSASGTYTVNVYLNRAAARRGEGAAFALEISVSALGTPSAPVQGDFADGLEGGPDYFEVVTSGAGMLNLRKSPSAAAATVTRLAGGTQVRNLGCRMNEGRRWCHVATLADPGDEGWAAGDFLREGSGAAQPPPAENVDAKVAGTDFNATGFLQCARTAAAAMGSCAFGVNRNGDGSGTITVTWPDGATRIIGFENNRPSWFDKSQADAGRELAVTQDNDMFLVTIGEERFQFPSVVMEGD